MSMASEVYQELVELRTDFIDESILESVFTDLRNGKKTRPVRVVRDKEEMAKIKATLSKWQELANKLVEADPVNFKKNNANFRLPVVMENVSDFIIRCNAATSSRKISRETILSRLETQFNREMASHSSPSDFAKKLWEEIAFFREEKEEEYRIRTGGWNDILVLHRELGHAGERLKKTRVPQQGMILFDPNKRAKITLPDSTSYKERKDSFGEIGLRSLPCSLPFGGALYRESDIRKAFDNSPKVTQGGANQEEAEAISTPPKN